MSKNDLGLKLGRISNSDEAYFNGKEIALTGAFPPEEFSKWYYPRNDVIPSSLNSGSTPFYCFKKNLTPSYIYRY